MHLQQIALWASVVVQGFAAGLWFYASAAKIDAKKAAKDYQERTGATWSPAQIVYEDGTDFAASAQLQSVWNKRAALVTGLGVALSAIAAALPSGASQ